jgi:hypothetical protein
MSLCLTEFSWNLTVKILLNLTSNLQVVSYTQPIAGSASSLDSVITNIFVLTLRTLHYLLKNKHYITYSIIFSNSNSPPQKAPPQNYSRRPCPLWTNWKTQLEGTRVLAPHSRLWTFRFTVTPC